MGDDRCDWWQGAIALSRTGTRLIIPHLRPPEWLVLATLHKTQAKTGKERIVALDLDRPLRITGQMMLDGSHKPARQDIPNRRSGSGLGDSPCLRDRRLHKEDDERLRRQRGRLAAAARVLAGRIAPRQGLAEVKARAMLCL
jgi:hypothetical protein